MLIPRQVVRNMYTKELDRGYSFNHLVIHMEAHVGKGVFLGGNNHEPSLASIGSEMVY